MTETPISIESVRDTGYRQTYGPLDQLGDSIKAEGLRRPITLWKDGSLISGARRLRTQFLMAGAHGGSRYRTIPAVFVDTIEESAKQLLADRLDDELSKPMTTVEICRLWQLLRELDEPAAVRRAEAARRRGVELRKATMAGKRKPARHGYSTDYVLGVLAPAFGMSESSAARLWAIYTLANSTAQPDDRREQARQALRNIDDGISSLWRNYSDLFAGNKTVTSAPKAVIRAESAPAAKQLLAWERALPQLDGLLAGLAELGPPSPELTRDQVGPVCARLAAQRRQLEQIIRKMKESE